MLLPGQKYVGEKKEETREARQGHVEKKKEKEKISCCLHNFNFFRLLYQPSFYSIMVRHFESRLAKAARTSQKITGFFRNNGEPAEPVEPPIPDEGENHRAAEDDDNNNDSDDDPMPDEGENDRAPDDDDNNDDGNNDDDYEEDDDADDDDEEEMEGRSQETWTEFNQAYFDQMKDAFDDATRRNRQFIDTKWCEVISPPDNVISHFKDEHPLRMEHFCIPKVLIWRPEEQYPIFYQDKRPNCKWHNCTDCVIKKGWVRKPRHCHTSDRIVALIGYFYVCRTRKDDQEHPYSFRSYDPDVIAKAPEYVKVQWSKFGYYLSHRSAISVSLLNQLRSGLNQGLGVSGFRNMLVENLKTYHMKLAIQWREYAEMISSKVRRGEFLVLLGLNAEDMEVDFADFYSKTYDQPIPSCSYLIKRVVGLMEADDDYKKRKMQMIDGKHLSGDHSFKLAKCILSNGQKVFTAMYCIMNEYGQVAAWWFTTGTGMGELESELKKLKRRYELMGYKSPESFATDRCCHERSYWTRVLELGQALESEDVQHMDLDDDDFVEVDVVEMPHEAKVATTLDMTNIFVGEISDFLEEQPREQKVIAIDCEWQIGQMKAEVLQIALMNDQVYIFHLKKISKFFPNSLKDLLGDRTVKKCGNRVHNDIKKLEAWTTRDRIPRDRIVKVHETVELGHLAHARALCGKGPSLVFLLNLLFPGVVLENKDHSGPRLSPWGQHLSPDQIQYAGNDAYCTMKIYQALMRIMDPKVEVPIGQEEAVPGLEVTLYSQNWKSRVASGVICDDENLGTRRQVLIQLDLRRQNSIFAPGTYVDVMNEDGSVNTVSLAALTEGLPNDESPQTVKVRCSLY